MCYNVAESVGSVSIDCEIQPEKGIDFFCFGNHSVVHNFGTTGPIHVGFSAICTSPNEHFNQIENWKCDMFDFRLISLDCITYVIINRRLSSVDSIVTIL